MGEPPPGSASGLAAKRCKFCKLPWPLWGCGGEGCEAALPRLCSCSLIAQRSTRLPLPYVHRWVLGAHLCRPLPVSQREVQGSAIVPS